MKKLSPTRVFVISALAAVTVIGSFIISLMVGARSTRPDEIIKIIPQALQYAFDPSYASQAELYSPQAKFELLVLLGTQRVPRTILALVTGACIGTAGAVIQGYTRNPLASPGILGINAGAAAAIAISVALGTTASTTGFAIPSLIGAILAAVIIFSLSSARSGLGSPLAIVLAGTTIAAIIRALVNTIVLKDSTALEVLRLWATGSVAGRPLEAFLLAAPMMALGLAIALTIAQPLNLFSLGEEVAHSLGLFVTFYRVLAVITVSVLAAAAVICAGPVSFIGLAAPHITRGLVSVDYRAVIPISGIIGCLVALWADILGRIIARPGELPMDIVIALFGAPLFIWIVRRGKVSGKL